MASLKRPFSSTQDGRDIPSKVQVIDRTSDISPTAQHQFALQTATSALAQLGSVMAQLARPIYVDNCGPAYPPQHQVPQPASTHNLYDDPRTSERLGHALHGSTYFAAPPSYTIAYQPMPAPNSSQAPPYRHPVQLPRYLQPPAHSSLAPGTAISRIPTAGRLRRPCGAQDSPFEDLELRRTIAKLPDMDPRLEEALEIIDEFDGDELRLLLKRTAHRYKHQVGAILKFEQERQRIRPEVPSSLWKHWSEVTKVLWGDYDNRQPLRLSHEAFEGWSAIRREITKIPKRLRSDTSLWMKRDAWDVLIEVGKELCRTQSTEFAEQVQQHARTDTTLSWAIYRCFACFTTDDKVELGMTDWLDDLEALRDSFGLIDFDCELLDAILIKAKEDLLFHRNVLMDAPLFVTDPDEESSSRSG